MVINLSCMIPMMFAFVQAVAGSRLIAEKALLGLRNIGWQSAFMKARVRYAGHTIEEECIVWAHKSSLNRKFVGMVCSVDTRLCLVMVSGCL